MTLSSKEIYHLGCRRGQAPVEVLKDALERKLFEAGVIIQDGGEEFPLIFATVGWNMKEHTLLLANYGADLNLLVKEDRYGAQNLAMHLCNTLPQISRKEKLEWFLTLQDLGLKWDASLDQNLLHHILENKNGIYNNQSILTHLLRNKSILNYDSHVETHQQALEVAILEHEYSIALRLIKKKFSTDMKDGTLLFSVAESLHPHYVKGRKTKQLETLTRYLIEQKKMDIHAQNQEGKTCLDVLEEHAQIVGFGHDLFSNWKAMVLKLSLSQNLPQHAQEPKSGRRI